MIEFLLNAVSSVFYMFDGADKTPQKGLNSSLHMLSTLISVPLVVYRCIRFLKLSKSSKAFIEVTIFFADTLEKCYNFLHTYRPGLRGG